MLTMPLAPWHAIVGKYLAAAAIIFLMLVLSFPIVWTINYLGTPDNGVIFSGFVATFLVALCFLFRDLRSLGAYPKPTGRFSDFFCDLYRDLSDRFSPGR